MKNILFGQAHRLFNSYNNYQNSPIITTFKLADENNNSIIDYLIQSIANSNYNILYIKLNSEEHNIKYDLKLFFDNKLLLDEVIINDKKLSFIHLHNSYFKEYINYDNLNYLLENLKKISDEYDIIYINYNSNIDENVLHICSETKFMHILISPLVKDIMDAYSALKLFVAHEIEFEPLIQIYNAEDNEDANIAFMNLNKASLHFLNKELKYIGHTTKNFDYNTKFSSLDKKYLYELKSVTKYIIDYTIKQQ
jgi:hypothetical protein